MAERAPPPSTLAEETQPPSYQSILAAVEDSWIRRILKSFLVWLPLSFLFALRFLCLDFLLNSFILISYAFFILNNATVVRMLGGDVLQLAASWPLLVILSFASAAIAFATSDWGLVPGLLQLSTPETLMAPILYATLLTDLLAKHATLHLKALFITFIAPIMHKRRCSRILQLLEEMSQFFRCLLPVPRWLWYFISCANARWEETTRDIFLVKFEIGVDIIFLFVYCILKTVAVREKGCLVWAALLAAVRVPMVGQRLHEESNPGECSICCEAICRQPVQLSCSHVYCLECIEEWLVENGKRTCPTCRAKVSIEDAPYGNGSTSLFVSTF